MFDSVFWIRAAQLVLSLAILIVCHEGGHFLAAKMFGIRVEKFFLFFDIKYHLVSTKDPWLQRLFPRIKKLETEYGIGWLPFGGYVKIAGMVDESMDKEQLKQPVQPWEFRAKRPWQRLIVMLGGVIVNMILAMIIYAGVMWSEGRDTIPMDRNFPNGFYFNKTACEMGFEHGDRLLRIDTTRIDVYSSAQILMDMAEAKTVTVERMGKETVIDMPEDFPLLTILQEYPPFLAPLREAIIDSVVAGSPAEKAGIMPGTRLTAIEDCDGVLTDISTWNQYNELFDPRLDLYNSPDRTAADSARMRNITVQFLCPGDTVCRMARITLNEDLKMGFRRMIPDYDLDHQSFTLLEAIPEGCALGWNTLVDYVGQLKYLFSKEGAKSVGSFGTIGSLFDSSWNWLRFWMMTALISVILAFMNVLPIPGLDGGHATFTIIEMVTGHTFSEKFQERAINIGFLLIMALMLLAIYNDIMKFVF